MTRAMDRRVSETTMAPRSSGFELELAAETDNVPLVRHALRGLLEASGVAEERISDITLAVTEACANAVLHAYPDTAGHFEASADLSPAGGIVVERAEPGVEVVVVTGEHDLSTAPELERRLDAALDSGHAVVVDLLGTTFIDSTVLRVLICARERAG